MARTKDGKDRAARQAVTGETIATRGHRGEAGEADQTVSGGTEAALAREIEGSKWRLGKDDDAERMREATSH